MAPVALPHADEVDREALERVDHGLRVRVQLVRLDHQAVQPEDGRGDIQGGGMVGIGGVMQ